MVKSESVALPNNLNELNPTKIRHILAGVRDFNLLKSWLWDAYLDQKFWRQRLLIRQRLAELGFKNPYSKNETLTQTQKDIINEAACYLDDNADFDSLLKKLDRKKWRFLWEFASIPVGDDLLNQVITLQDETNAKNQ